ncbi:hypothetical protein [Streptomyces xylophagus]|uniref:hypothetical protein n=1 Tax=Streptomyces xylophagus TaxID=285514 RepID=UPI000A44975E|nr:hypothetical protein [Streptomyces xylophagus]
MFPGHELDGVRAVRAEQVPLDEHLLFLCDLLDGAGLAITMGDQQSPAHRQASLRATPP